MEAVDKAERKVGIEHLVNPSEEAMTKAFGKHEQIYSVTERPTDPDALKNDLENWLSDVTVEKDEVLK